MGEKMHKITMTNFQMQTLQDAFEHFITRCRVKNLSEETITSYRSKVAHFLIFISPDTALLEIDERPLKTLSSISRQTPKHQTSPLTHILGAFGPSFTTAWRKGHTGKDFSESMDCDFSYTFRTTELQKRGYKNGWYKEQQMVIHEKKLLFWDRHILQ